MVPVALAPPPVTGHPCRRWSLHAAELAQCVQPVLQHWPDTPATACLVAEGLLRPLGRGLHLGPREHLSLPERAVAIGCALGRSLRASQVIAGPSAAWVLTGGDPPRAPLTLITAVRPVALADVLLRQVPLRAADVESIGGCPVTVPARTVVDVLRFEDSGSGRRLAAGILATGHVSEAEVEAALRRAHGLPHVRTATTRWMRLLSGEECPPPGIPPPRIPPPGIPLPG